MSSDLAIAQKSLAASGLLRNSAGNLALRDVFRRRLNEEMKAREISANQLSKRANGIGQTTISRILRGAQDPTLAKIDVLAKGLDVPPWFLLM